jgi:hypothetical protein
VSARLNDDDGRARQSGAVKSEARGLPKGLEPTTSALTALRSAMLLRVGLKDEIRHHAC